MGLKADIILWDLEARKLLHKMSLHKVSRLRPCMAPCNALPGQSPLQALTGDCQ